MYNNNKGKIMIKNEINILKQVVSLATLLEQLTKEVARIQARVKKIESGDKLDNLLSESEKKSILSSSYGGTTE